MSGENCKGPEVDFESASPESLGLDPHSVNRASPSGDQYLYAVLKDMHITQSHTILDVGCGKGSAMSVMARFPFLFVAGIDVSSTLAKIAATNFEKLRLQRCFVRTCDAQEFQQYDLFDFFYMYNPFPCAIMEKVLSQMELYLYRVVKKRTLIYNNPVCHEVVIDHGWSKISEYPDVWGNKIFVYSIGK